MNLETIKQKEPKEIALYFTQMLPPCNLKGELKEQIEDRDHVFEALAIVNRGFQEIGEDYELLEMAETLISASKFKLLLSRVPINSPAYKDLSLLSLQYSSKSIHSIELDEFSLQQAFGGIAACIARACHEKPRPH